MSSTSANKRTATRTSPPTSPVASSPSTVRSQSRPTLSHIASNQRRSTAGRERARRGSVASVTSSIGGTLDTAAPSGANSVDTLSENAISTLLSPAIVRTGLVAHTSLPASSAHRAPTVRDIPAVTLTTIPHVESSTFKEYLAQVGPLFDAFQRAKIANDEAISQSSTRSRPPESDEFSEVFGRHSRKRSTSSPTITRRPSAFSPPHSPTTPRSPRTPRFGPSRRNNAGPTSLSTIPNVYFEDNFQLENPRIFDVVSEHAEIIPPDRSSSNAEDGAVNGSAKPPARTQRRALHTNAILQEKLSWYMDTVEVHLISSIAAASSSFFAALGSLKELQAEAADSIAQIKLLRSALQKLDLEMAVGGLEVVSMKRKRQNIIKLESAVGQLCEVVEKAKACEELVEAGDVDAATLAIDELEDLIAGKAPSTESDERRERRDLRQLKALEGISEGIAELRLRIGRGFEDRFKEALLTDLREHVKRVPAKDTLQRWAQATFRSKFGHQRDQSIPPAYLATNDQLRPVLQASLAGLSKAGHTARATTAYREAVMREIKGMIRKHLPSSSDDDAESTTSVSTRGGRRLNTQEKSAILARNLRALDTEAAEELLTMVYTSIGEALRRLGVQVKVLLDVTSSMDAHPNDGRKSNEADAGTRPHSNSASQIREEVTQALDMSSLLGQAVDVVQGQVNKVLKVRSEQNVHLPLDQFLRFFTLNRLFADECEAVSSRAGDALKDVVNSQVREFVNVMGEREKQHINQVLEEDRWEAKDFGPSEEIVLSRVLDAMTKTPKAWTNFTSLWDGGEGATTSNGSVNGAGNEPADKARSADIDGQRYILVNSGHAALHSIDNFAHLIAAIPMLTPDASAKLLDLLKLFNSRACQLILGAGATRSAGLKNITTKHLALASQACSFIVAILPYVREFVRKNLPTSTNSSNLLAEFDRTKRLFQDHQMSIHEKLVEIMGGRSNAHIAAMRKVDFDGQAAQQQEGPSKYAEDLTKETNTLHRVLSRHVSEIDLKMVMLPIFQQYREDWGKAFAEVGVKTDAGKARLLRDVELIDSRLSKIDGSNDLGTSLLEVVRGRSVGVSQGQTNGPTKSGGGETAPRRSKDDQAKKDGAPLANEHQRQSSVNILGNGEADEGRGQAEGAK